MTPEERAEKIAKSLFASPKRQEEAVGLIAAQIREAVEEANETLKQNYKHWTDTAMKAAYEDAAKIAEGDHSELDIGHRWAECSRCDAARAIRARNDLGNLREALSRIAAQIREAVEEGIQDFVRISLEDDPRLPAADALAKALSQSRGQWIHSVNAKDCLEALAAYEKARGE